MHFQRSIYRQTSGGLANLSVLFTKYNAAGFLFDQRALNPANLGMWQENTKATQTTAAGQSVGYLTDYGLDARDVTQSTSTARPALQQTAGVWHLDYDGGDSLALSGPFAYAGGSFTLIAAVKGAAQTAHIFAEALSSVNTRTKYLFSAGITDTAKMSLYIENDADEILLNVDGTVDAFDDTWKVLTWIDTGTAYELRVNGAAAGSANYTRSGVMSVDAASLGVSPDLTPDSFFTGSVGTIFGIGASMEASDVTGAERRIAAKNGITI